MKKSFQFPNTVNTDLCLDFVNTQHVYCALPGHLCTPDFNLTARPGSLTVHLSRNTPFLREHANHAKYRVYYGKKGEALQVRNLVSYGLFPLQRGLSVPCRARPVFGCVSTRRSSS